MHKDVTLSDSVKGFAAYLGYVIATYPTAALGQTTDNFETLDQGGDTISAAIVNASQSIPMVLDLMFAGLFLIGLIFIAMGLYKMVQRADGRDIGWSGILMHFVVASVFIASGPWMNVAMTTLDGSAVSVLSYTPPRAGLSGTVSVDACMVMQAIVGFVVLIGWIGFFRGWWMLKSAVESGGGGRHTQGDGYVFIVGGVLAANVCWTHAMVVATLRVDLMNVLTQGAGCGC